MRLRSLTTHIMRTTAIALPLLGAPFTVKMVDHGLKVAPAQAWAESDHGNGGGHDSGGDHGGSSGGSDHSSSSGGGGDHSSSGGHDDHSNSGGSHDASQDQSRDQNQSHDQDRLAQDRDSWLGVSGQSSSAQTSNSGSLTPVPQDEERQLIEHGWAGDDAQGNSR